MITEIVQTDTVWSENYNMKQIGNKNSFGPQHEGI